MKKFSNKVFYFTFFIMATMPITWSTGRAAEIDDLVRDKNKFSYYQLGKHVPPRSGYANYTGARTVIHSSIGLPIELRLGENEHLYCNTQVWGFLSNGKPSGKSNHERNYTFPWTSTFCEQRWPPAPQQTRACGPTSPIAHQGTDCRPAAPKDNTYWMIAVEDGVISHAGFNLVTLVGTASGIRWKYRHGNAPIVSPGKSVRKGDRLATIADLGSTPIHLHLESERPVGGVIRDVDNLPSLIVAYQNALGNPTSIQDGELAFDPNFEITETAVSGSCGAEHQPALANVEAVKFSSLWCHNGSVMGLIKSNGKVEFVYYKPRNSDIAQAARRNPLLFAGESSGTKISGQARHYSTRCGDKTFPAEGENAQPDRLIQISGIRANFSNSDCNVTTEKRETLIFSYLRDFEVQQVTDPLEPERKSKTEITRNWGAITMYVPWEQWLPYIKNWPGLSLDAAGLPYAKALKDKFNGWIPALETDESGVGMWWYWLAVRKGFGEAGKPTFRQIARGIAGDEASDASLQNYINAYIRLSPQYFGRSVSADEAISLSDPHDRWALGWTMFHHESGRTPLISRVVFDCGVKLGTEAIKRGVNDLKTIKYHAFIAPACAGSNAPNETASQPDVEAQGSGLALQLDKLKAKVEELSQQNAALNKRVEELDTKMGQIKSIVAN